MNREQDIPADDDTFYYRLLIKISRYPEDRWWKKLDMAKTHVKDEVVESEEKKVLNSALQTWAAFGAGGEALGASARSTSAALQVSAASGSRSRKRKGQHRAVRYMAIILFWKPDSRAHKNIRIIHFIHRLDRDVAAEGGNVVAHQ